MRDGISAKMREKEENTILHDLTGRKVKFQVPGNNFHKITPSPEVLLLLMYDKHAVLRYT